MNHGLYDTSPEPRANHAFRPLTSGDGTRELTACQIAGCNLGRDAHPVPLTHGKRYYEVLAVLISFAIAAVVVVMLWFLLDTVVRGLGTITVPIKP
jgi:hypothetical protein